jgi:hypothetical protein
VKAVNSNHITIVDVITGEFMNYFSMILLALLTFSEVFAAEFFPPPFAAEYKLYVQGIPVGKGKRSLTALPNGNWIFETSGETTGLVSLFQSILIEERSVFTLVNGKVRPLEYTYRQSGKKPRLDTLFFDWQNHEATSTYREVVNKIPLTNDGILDRLVYQIVLMQELTQGKRQLQYAVAHKDKVSVYTPTYLGKEQVETGMGVVETLKYERVSTDQERRTTFWCAPNWYYLPARVEHQEEDGEVFSLVLQSLTGLQ